MPDAPAARATASAPVAKPRSAEVSGPLGRHARVVLGLASLATFLTLWELSSRAGLIDEFFFSKPTSIVAAGLAEIQLPRFWNDVRVSAFELVAGFALAAGTAIPLGLVFGWFKRLSYMADPWLNLFNSLPRIALLPMIVLWLGLGVESKLAVVFLGAFFSIVIPTVQGVRTVDRRFLDVAHSFGASHRRLFTSVVFPATVPFIATGLRLGIGRALIGVVLAEIYAQTEGLGVMIERAADTLQSDRMIFAILLFTASGIVGVEALRRVERHFHRWRPAAQEG